MTTSPATRPLTPSMRAALVDRSWVKYPQAKGLAGRGLATYERWSDSIEGRYTVTLTEAGKQLRDQILAPLTPGVRVRNTLTGFVGRVIRVESSDRFDTVVLLWDGSQNETCGSPAYLEVLDAKPAVPTKVQRLLDIAARYDELTATEIEPYRGTRCWKLASSAQHKQHQRVLVYWTPAANGGSVRIHKYYGAAQPPARVTQAQAYIAIAMLAGH